MYIPEGRAVDFNEFYYGSLYAATSEHDTVLSLSTNGEDYDQFPFSAEEEQTPGGGETELAVHYCKVIHLSDAQLVIANSTPLPYNNIVTGHSPA